ncbi:hypothetical protein [Lignipirellula cremea]|uniref:Cytochrome c domain-containing protein n=1 Tax=Lignipirellula cremea TaxID=2528010 RepID=A0A518E2B8_9BACT|nr:hypothetical protein [Lignipirellula cremea]QDU98230.1 hypothetical protein Pla8534_60910 [Lignipirellula cremea]
MPDFLRLFAGPLTALLLVALHNSPALAQLEFEQAPIHYGKAPTHDPVMRLQEQLEKGEVKLDYDEQRGYLPALLQHLGIETSSQVLVYSKTSFQLRRIAPRHPRALYFNDESYVGWVQQGDMVEVMTTDPEQGEIFYTLSQEPAEVPRFTRDSGRCILCHASSRTQRVPGGLVRSVFADDAGQPQFSSGTFNIDHRSPFTDRWGGWYVTGTHGKMRHMGNVTSKNRRDPEAIDREAGANVTDLSELFDVSPYLTPHSDIVALMVLEHQTQMQNFITLASYENRSTAHYDGIMNEALDRPADHVSDTSKRRVAAAGEKLLAYLLFAEEFPLTSPIQGTSTFARDFQAKGPRDSKGRSLRDLDLQTRMFKYPCSYLIYSPAFDALPPTVKSYVTERLLAILEGQDESRTFAHLTTDDRKAILDILRETKPDLWK